MRLLAGDIGGTKTALSLFEATTPLPCAVSQYASADFGSLEAVIERFLAESSMGPTDIAAACFGIAGPVVAQTSRTTNLPWRICAASLSKHLSCPVRLINDFEAVAFGVPCLTSSQVHPLTDGIPDVMGPMAIIGAGTGLGQAVVVPTPAGPKVLDSEGGHADFAARTVEEFALLEYLQQRHGRVSVERAVSGPGLAAIYDFLVDSQPRPSSDAAREIGGSSDRSAAIGRLGLTHKDATCRQALTLFVSLYGAEAGNLALKVLPTGGLYIAGGIAPKILPALTDGTFLKALTDKGRMAPLLHALPIRVVLEPKVGLLGAQQEAIRLATHPSAAHDVPPR